MPCRAQARRSIVPLGSKPPACMPGASGTHHTLKCKIEKVIWPSRPLVRLIVHVVGDILDVVGAELLTEGGHVAIALGDLRDDRLNAVFPICDERLLLDLLLGHDAVVAAGVACHAIASEDTLAVLQVSSKCRTAADHGGEQSQGGAEGQWTEQAVRACCRD